MLFKQTAFLFPLVRIPEKEPSWLLCFFDEASGFFTIDVVTDTIAAMKCPGVTDVITMNEKPEWTAKEALDRYHALRNEKVHFRVWHATASQTITRAPTDETLVGRNGSGV